MRVLLERASPRRGMKLKKYKLGQGLIKAMDEAAAQKYDDGKPDMSLLSPIAITKIAEVMTFGKKKYEAHNWRSGLLYSRLLAAALRHILAYMGGEDRDRESGLSHLAHASCCLMFLLEFEVTHADKDDRYKGSTK